MDKRFWAFLVVIAIVLCGVFFVTNTKKAEAPASSSTSAKGVLTSHVAGKSTTGVKLVEYGDFQCPACAQYDTVVKEVVSKYADKITFQFRNFPLFQIHPNAIGAARAAEAADMQGKYWDMHGMLYENQEEWSRVSDPTPAFNQYATKLSLDIAKFKLDYKSTLANDRIQADLKEGNRLNVESTPTFLIDGKKISNPNATVADFSKIIDAAIAKKGGSTKATSTPTSDPAAKPPETTPVGQ